MGAGARSQKRPYGGPVGMTSSPNFMGPTLLEARPANTTGTTNVVMPIEMAPSEGNSAYPHVLANLLVSVGRPPLVGRSADPIGAATPATFIGMAMLDGSHRASSGWLP